MTFCCRGGALQPYEGVHEPDCMWSAWPSLRQRDSATNADLAAVREWVDAAVAHAEAVVNLPMPSGVQKLGGMKASLWADLHNDAGKTRDRWREVRAALYPKNYWPNGDPR